MKHWIIRIALGLLGILALGLLCGTLYEAWARHRLAQQFPLPGNLVDVGGHKLRMDCQGAGSPTVVFEGGLSSSGLLEWSSVQASVAKITRACAYSRAGILGSDPWDGPRNADAIADDLKALLVGLGVHPPLVLVAHSLGGIYAMSYTRKFGSDVAGLVLVESSHADMLQRTTSAGLHLKDPVRPLRVAQALAWTGLVRAIVGSLDADSAYLPTSLAGMLKEGEAVKQSLAEAGEFRQLGNRPLFVLTAGKLADEFLTEAELTPEEGRRFQEIWRSLQEDQATWSTRSQHEIVANATHALHQDSPDRVINAVQWVVDAVRADAEH